MAIHVFFYLKKYINHKVKFGNLSIIKFGIGNTLTATNIPKIQKDIRLSSKWMEVQPIIKQKNLPRINCE